MWLFIFSLIIGYVSGQQYSNVYYPQTRTYHSHPNLKSGHYTQVPVTTTHEHEHHHTIVPSVITHQHGHYTHSVPVTGTHQHYVEPETISHTTVSSPSHHHEGYHRHSYDNIHDTPILRYENTNNGDGNYHFAYETADGLKQEEQSYYSGSERIVRGFYSYIGPENKVYTVHYYADDTGFHASGDHLPTSSQVKK